jgi:hypothetical protein
MLVVDEGQLNKFKKRFGGLEELAQVRVPRLLREGGPLQGGAKGRSGCGAVVLTQWR